MSGMVIQSQPLMNKKQQAKYRELDKRVAIAIGYSVHKMDAGMMYLLVRPKKSFTVPLGGLYTISGKGPEHPIYGPLMSRVGRSPEEAWEWVPYFTTNMTHFEALLTYVHHSLRLSIQTPLHQPKDVCNEIIRRINER